MICGNPPETLQRYRALLQHDSTCVDAWLNLGIALARAGNKAAARQAWQRVLHYNPDHPHARAYVQQLQAP